MQKTILITGATDGIGLATAKILAKDGHTLLIHGRNEEKLKHVKAELSALAGAGDIQTYIADLSLLDSVKIFAHKVKTEHSKLDVLLNNAGILKTEQPITKDGLDIRLSVNTIAPYILTKVLAPTLGKSGRVINLSSAAQAQVDINELQSKNALTDMEAYAQSKLAITMWSFALAKQYQTDGPAIISVNPGSLLASKMVKQGFGIPGKDINIGAQILVRLCLEAQMNQYTGKYFDNDIGDFSSPHPDAENLQKSKALIDNIEFIIR